MQRFIFFLTAAFLYLALLHSYSPFEKQIIDIQNQPQLLNEIKRSSTFNEKHPYTFILTDIYREGVFLKTSFITIKSVSPFHSPLYFSYKVSSNYYHYLKPYLGFEIARHSPHKSFAQNSILPPGFSFVANPILGYWKKRKWHFYRFYKQLYKELAWDTPISQYKPNVKQYRAVLRHPQTKGKYVTRGISNKLIRKTRERQNIIMDINKLFGSQGFHTPYIAQNHSQREKSLQNNSALQNISNFYKKFFAAQGN